MLKDGAYKEELRNLELLFRGSENQRLLSKCAREKIRESYAAG